MRILKQGEELWFVAKDVCDILEIQNPTDAIKSLYDSEKANLDISYGSQNRHVNVINEPALYKLVFKSRKPEARRFQDWVFYQVLPSLRNTGTYSAQRTVPMLTGKATDTKFYSMKWRIKDKIMNELQVFKNENFSVRTIEQDGQVWFVAKDVCDILEIANVSQAISDLDDDERMTISNTYSHEKSKRGGASTLLVISESGVYSLIFKSRKPEAKNFARWVRKEVLPQIIHTGSYSVNKLETPKALPEPDSIEILVFNYNGHDVRIFEDEYGERLIACSDITAIIYDFYHWIDKEVYMNNNENELFELSFENHLFHVYQDGETFWFVSHEIYDYFEDIENEIEEEYQGFIQGESVINDNGLYKIIRLTDTPKARRFYTWIEKKVLNKVTAKIVKAYK